MKKLLTLLFLLCMSIGAWAHIAPGSYAIKVYGTNKYLNPTDWTVKGNNKMAYTTTARPAWDVLDGSSTGTNVISVEGSVQTLNPYHYNHATDPQTTVGCWSSGIRDNNGDAEWSIEPVETVAGAYTIKSKNKNCYLSYDAGNAYVLMTATTISPACYFVFEDLSAPETPLLTIGCVSDVHCMNNMITPSSGNLDDITVRSSLTTVLNRMKTEDNPDVLVFGGDSESDNTIAEENSNKVRQVLAEAMRGVFQDGKNPNVLWMTGNHDYEVANFDNIPKPYNAGNFYDFPMKQDIGQLDDSDLFYEYADNGARGQEKLLAAYHYVINGFDFVVLNCGKYFFRNAWDYTFSTESATWVQNKLQEIDPDGTKTVFFLCHVPFPDSNSINASGNKGMKTTEGYPILKAACAAHPNLIMLYGHDHGQDNAYIREKTSQRVTLYDPSGNVITTTDANHVDGTMPEDAPEGGETSEEMSLDNICLKSQSSQYFSIDGSNNIVMQNTPYSFTCGEIDGVDNAHNLKLASSSRWINSGTNGLLSTTTTNNDDNVRHFYFYEVTSNNGSTITAKQVNAPSANKDYLLGVSNIKSGSNGFYVVYAQAGNSSSVRLDVVRINNSSIVTLSNGKKTVSDIPQNITLTSSNTDSYGNPIVFNKVLWQVEKMLTTGTFYVTHNDQHLIKDANNLNLGNTETEHALTAGSATGTFKLETSSGKYLHIGSSGRWSDGTANDLLLFGTDGKRVYNIVSGQPYYIVALYSSNSTYYAMKGTVFGSGSGQRMDTQAVTLNSDQTQMTATPGDNFLWTFNDVNAPAPSTPGSAEPAETSFFSSFMGSLRYYYNTIEGNSTDPADSPRVVQALVVKVYEDRVELHMKNYNETGTINGITIAATPTPYTSFRTVTHSEPVEYVKGDLINYTLTDEAGSEYSGSYYGSRGDYPTFAGVTGVTYSDENWEDNPSAGIEYRFTATINFPFPVSSATVHNYTYIGIQNNNQRLLFNDNGNVKMNPGVLPNNGNVDNYKWEIVPSLSENTFTFLLKNFNGKYIAGTEATNHDNTFALSVEGTGYAFSDVNGGRGFNVPNTTKFLSVNSPGTADQNLCIWNKNNDTHTGCTLGFPAPDDFEALMTKLCQYELADGIGNYNTTEENATKIADVKAGTQYATVAEFNAMMGACEINQPTAGFYYFKGTASGHYMTVHATNANLNSTASTRGTSNIFYLSADNKLIPYSRPLYIKVSDGLAVANVGEEGLVAEFLGSNTMVGSYNIKVSATNNYFYDWTTDNTEKVLINNERDHDRCQWTLEPVEELNVTLNANSGCASFYAPVAMTVTEGDAYIAIVKDASTITLSPIADNVIPAGYGVILKGSGTATLSFGGEVTEDRENALKGSAYTKVKPTDEGTIYVLVNNNGAPAFQMYSGANVNGFKAYLPITGSNSNLRVVFDEGIATDIEAITDNGQIEIFDLQGRRVQKAKSGIYIVNGKAKVIR